MRRGFKSEAERLAERTRSQFGLAPTATLDVRALVRHQGIQVVSADELVGIGLLEELEALQPYAFSAATFHLPDGRRVIVYNPCHDLARINSDIAHELSHILLEHKVREVQQLGGHTFFTCDPDQEEEATWLGGCLLLPRPLLLREAYQHADAEAIANRHQVTLQMAKFRLNTSGVLLQARRAQASRAR